MIGQEPQRPPRVGLKLLGRAAIAAVLVVALSASAVAATVILQVDTVKHAFLGQGRETIDIPEITKADAGGPRTVLIIGSDQRYGDKKAGVKARSDTLLLVRADPDQDAIAVMSIPRDLKVDIPGYARTKINEAYERGGPRLTVKTIKKLFEDSAGEKFPINNVLVVDFGGFRRAVNYIKGVYVDVDRKYFNDNSGPDKFATIDVDAGYQKLRGQDALDYVRYRHGDSDLIRAARQQDFLRQARQQAGVKRLLSLGDREKLARIFGRYFEVDRSFTSTQEIFSILKLGLFLSQQKVDVNEVRFQVTEAPNPKVDTSLFASDASLKSIFADFMGAKGSRKPRQQSKPTQADRDFQKARRREKHKRVAKAGPVPGLVDARTEGQNLAILADPKLKMPFYFPAQRTARSVYAGTAGQSQPRIYTIKDELGRRHEAYRLTLYNGVIGEYYGIQGMTWKDPPILDNPDRTRTVGGRKLRLYYDGSTLRLVAWKSGKGVFWVTNTLDQALTNDQMVGIVASLRRLKG